MLKVEYEYQTDGLNGYSVFSDYIGVYNLIVDNEDRKIATISALGVHGNWHSVGESEIEVLSGDNNINLIMLALCVNMGNREEKLRRHG